MQPAKFLTYQKPHHSSSCYTRFARNDVTTLIFANINTVNVEISDEIIRIVFPNEPAGSDNDTHEKRSTEEDEADMLEGLDFEMYTNDARDVSEDIDEDR
ncbi:hypothetical protein M3J09_006331 [Ascochyta lentis]